MNTERPPRGITGITPAVWAAVLAPCVAFWACAWFGVGWPLLNAWLGR